MATDRSYRYPIGSVWATQDARKLRHWFRGAVPRRVSIERYYGDRVHIRNLATDRVTFLSCDAFDQLFVRATETSEGTAK